MHEANGRIAAAPGDRLWLCAPAEPYHGLHIVVTAVADFGVHFVAPGHFHPRAAPGWELRGRALWSELRDEAPAAALEGEFPLSGPGLDNAGTMKADMTPAWTGDVCVVCGSVRMLRSGSCATCQDCGSTSGCG